MDVELLTIPGCPHAEQPRELFARALELEGVDPGEVNVKAVESEEVAALRGFTGSPTFRLGGRDIFPSATGPALSCRLYPTTSGPSGLPELASLRRAVRDSIDSGIDYAVWDSGITAIKGGTRHRAGIRVRLRDGGKRTFHLPVHGGVVPDSAETER